MNQSKALTILKSGQNVFLTGSAGTGKTYVLNQYIEFLRKHKLAVAITASTGIAATHMNGQTIHSWCGIGVKDQLSPKDLKNLKTKKYITKNVEKAAVLIIDEISMLHKYQLDMVNKVLKYLRESEAPFGGIQVVLCGDFFQLPPVSRLQEDSKEKFCFMSDAWAETQPTVCYLTEQYRQQNNELTSILNEIRLNQITETSTTLLKQAENNSLTGEITKLYTHNMDVDRINEEHFQKLNGQSRVFDAKLTGKPVLSEMLSNTVLANEKLKLKKGAKVMFVKNNNEKGYVNGTLGEVSDYWENDNGKKFPIVKTFEGKHIYVDVEKWSMEDEGGKTLASFAQLPLRLAWAITVHKSQGMTLDAAEVDLSKTFELGQGYVALSRVKDLKGLKLNGFNETSLKVDKLAFRAGKRFEILSNEAEEKFDEKELLKAKVEFIIENNGALNPTEKKVKKKNSKKTKISTYERTHNLLTQGNELTEIAKERALTEQTVLRHFLVIKQEYSDTDFSSLKPAQSLINKIQKSVVEIKSKEPESLFSKNGNISLGPIYKVNKGKIDYKEIMLALLFCEY